MPAQLILVRHGQSLWNQEGRFTGWSDVDLSIAGEQQAHQAGQQLQEQALTIHHAYTSVLKRAIRTLWIMLSACEAIAVPTTPSWRLNERHYGALQGQRKQDIIDQYGQEQVHIWRRSYRIAPPPRAVDHKNPFPPPAAYCPAEPDTESLHDTYERLVPLLDAVLPGHIAREDTVIFCAHGNSLRAMIKHLTALSDTAVTQLEIAHARPLIFHYGDAGWQSTTALSLS